MTDDRPMASVSIRGLLQAPELAAVEVGSEVEEKQAWKSGSV